LARQISERIKPPAGDRLSHHSFCLARDC